MQRRQNGEVNYFKFYMWLVTLCKKILFFFLCDFRNVAKKTVRPVSHYAIEIKFKHAHTEKENFGFANSTANSNKVDNKHLMNGGGHLSRSWYRDVVELRKKAEEYRVCVSQFFFRLFLLFEMN